MLYFPASQTRKCLGHTCCLCFPFLRDQSPFLKTGASYILPIRFLCPWGFSRQEYWSGLPCSPPGNLPNPGIQPRSPTLWADSLPSEPPGKPTNTGVGSLSLLQGIFPTQGSNQSLLHCRQILYQLRYQGSPLIVYFTPYNCFICIFVPLGTFSYVASWSC